MISKQNQDTLKEYANIKAEIKLLEKKAEEINPVVLDIMRKEELEEISIEDQGKLSLASRRTWKYSSDTQEKEKALKQIKKEEEQTGLADYSEKHYVIFKVAGERDE